VLLAQLLPAQLLLVLQLPAQLLQALLWLALPVLLLASHELGV
jgi:hypothetical protein